MPPKSVERETPRQSIDKTYREFFAMRATAERATGRDSAESSSCPRSSSREAVNPRLRQENYPLRRGPEPGALRRNVHALYVSSHARLMRWAHPGCRRLSLWSSRMMERSQTTTTAEHPAGRRRTVRPRRLRPPPRFLPCPWRPTRP